MTTPPALPRVAILLSTFNGAAFLPAQLDSYLAQKGVEWVLYWRDDGSRDGSVAIMEAFGAGAGVGRLVTLGAGHVGVTASYMALLRRAVADGAGPVAFSDQDDVWLPGKLARGWAQMGETPAPVLYCSRQVLVDVHLRPICRSAPLPVSPGLGPALTQNIATGCTVMLNTAAAALVAGSVPPLPSLHDWWSYLVVAAAGGLVVADAEPTVMYRQHGGNAVGAPRTKRRRALAALRRGPGAFMTVLRAQVSALRGQPALLSPASRIMLDAVAGALAGGVATRARVLRRYGLLRQTRSETWLFRCWFLFG